MNSFHNNSEDEILQIIDKNKLNLSITILFRDQINKDHKYILYPAKTKLIKDLRIEV